MFKQSPHFDIKNIQKQLDKYNEHISDLKKLEYYDLVNFYVEADKKIKEYTKMLKQNRTNEIKQMLDEYIFLKEKITDIIKNRNKNYHNYHDDKINYLIKKSLANKLTNNEEKELENEFAINIISKTTSLMYDKTTYPKLITIFNNVKKNDDDSLVIISEALFEKEKEPNNVDTLKFKKLKISKDKTSKLTEKDTDNINTLNFKKLKISNAKTHKLTKKVKHKKEKLSELIDMMSSQKK